LLATAQENKWNITFSIGAATFAESPDSLESMIRIADAAMYSIKAGGKDNVSVVYAR
jgi:diguanylate cyclase (GGDEF)-like protein